jgi:hypothetical protein
MNKHSGFSYFSCTRLCLPMIGLAFASPLWALAETAEPQKPSWYLQGAVGAWAPQKQSLHVDLGGPVSLTGQVQYGSDLSGAIAFGRQSWTELKEGSPVPVRLEVEGWQGTGKRRSVDLGVLHVQPDDKVRANALFLNGWLRVHRGDEVDAQRQPLWNLWLGAGMGYASVKYPEASGISGCNCLRAASQNGAAWQLKLSLERQVSESTRLVAQLGQVYLPAVKTSGDLVPQTAYARLQGPTLSLGVRMDLR